MRPTSSDRGFTLIELLVAMVIFAIISLTLFAAFNTFLETAARIRSEVMGPRQFQIGMTTMTEDLTQVFLTRYPEYRKPGFNTEPAPYRFEATRETIGGKQYTKLRFSSLNHAVMNDGPQNRLGIIVYYVNLAADGVLSLHRSDTLPQAGPQDPSPCADPILLNGIERFDASFTDADGEIHDTWDSDARDCGYALPATVLLSLALKGETRSIPVETAIPLPVIREPEK